MEKIPFSRLGVASHQAHVHVTQLRPGQATRKHGHDFFEVLLVTAGRGVHRINRGEVALAPGYLVLVRLEDMHCFAAAEDEPLVFVNVAVSAPWWRAFHALTGLEPGWERAGEPAGHVRLPPQRRGAMEATMLGLRAGASGEGVALAEAWKKITQEFSRRDPEGAREEPPAWLEEWRRLLASADLTTLGEDIGAWQKRSGRTPEHLARSCRRHYGMTPSAMVGAARIERAKQLLRGGDAKVITVAMECGFQNMAHFHRLFAKHVGETPGQWRRGHSVAVPV